MVFMIDPELLIKMSEISRGTVGTISSGVSLTNRLVEHNDWNCKERYTIQEHIRQIKTRMRGLEEQITSFSDNLTKASNQYVELEKKWILSMGSVDSAIGNHAAIPTSFPVVNSSSVISNVFKESFSADAPYPLTGYAISRFSQPISVCSFEDMNFFKEKKK